MLMPSFHRHPNEAAIIGRIIVGFGELEFMLAGCMVRATSMHKQGMPAVFQLGSTSARIDLAEVLAREAFQKRGAAKEFGDTVGAVRTCYAIRNQYAHCHWADHQKGGLFFTNMEEAAERADFELFWKHVDVPLLTAQEDYFNYAVQCLLRLEELFPANVLRTPPSPLRTWPPKQKPPPRHNHPLQHVPPWLSATQQKRHRELAEAQERHARPRLGKTRRPPKLSSRQRRERAMRKRKPA